MKFIRMGAAFLARFFMSAIFLASGINKLLNWHETEKMLMNTLCDWQIHFGFSETAQSCLASLTPWTPILLIVATLFELIGGLLILLGVNEKLGAAMLILFLIPTTFFFHPFWYAEANMKEFQTVMFLKNLAILGGLILIILHGVRVKKLGGGDPFQSMKLG